MAYINFCTLKVVLKSSRFNQPWRWLMIWRKEWRKEGSKGGQSLSFTVARDMTQRKYLLGKKKRQLDLWRNNQPSPNNKMSNEGSSFLGGKIKHYSRLVFYSACFIFWKIPFFNCTRSFGRLAKTMTCAWRFSLFCQEECSDCILSVGLMLTWAKF